MTWELGVFRGQPENESYLLQKLKMHKILPKSTENPPNPNPQVFLAVPSCMIYQMNSHYHHLDMKKIKTLQALPVGFLPLASFPSRTLPVVTHLSFMKDRPNVLDCF